MFLDGLDKLDRAIVQLLIGNARMSYSELGERTGISRVAAKMRVRSLEQRGVIEGYTTIVNPQRIGGALSCYFEIETRPETLEEAIRQLKENETVTQIYRVTGRDRLHVHAVAADQQEFERFTETCIDRLPGIRNLSTHLILTRIKDEAPAYYGDKAVVEDSLIADGCHIEGHVKNCVLFRDVVVEKGAEVCDCIIMEGGRILSDASLRHVITDRNVVIRDGRTMMGHENYPITIAKNATV